MLHVKIHHTLWYKRSPFDSLTETFFVRLLFALYQCHYPVSSQLWGSAGKGGLGKKIPKKSGIRKKGPRKKGPTGFCKMGKVGLLCTFIS